jgi:hypothetical protein
MPHRYTLNISLNLAYKYRYIYKESLYDVLPFIQLYELVVAIFWRKNLRLNNHEFMYTLASRDSNE